MSKCKREKLSVFLVKLYKTLLFATERILFYTYLAQYDTASFLIIELFCQLEPLSTFAYDIKDLELAFET